MHSAVPSILLPASWDAFSPETWARHIERVEGRVIRFAPVVLPPGMFGARIVALSDNAVTEWVFFAAQLSRVHQDHIKAHELAHIVLGHPTLVVERDAPFAAFASTFPLCQRASAPAFRGVEPALETDAEELTRWIFERVLWARRARDAARLSSHACVAAAIARMGLAG